MPLRVSTFEFSTAGFSLFQGVDYASTLALLKTPAAPGSTWVGARTALRDKWHHRDRIADGIFQFDAPAPELGRADLEHAIADVLGQLAQRGTTPRGAWDFTLYIAADDDEHYWIGVHDVYQTAEQ